MKNLELPHDESAERAIISAVLMDNDCLYDINLTPNDFFDWKNRYIYQSILELIKLWKRADTITLLSHIALHNLAISDEYIMEIAWRLIIPTGHKDYAKTVKDLSNKRKLIKSSQSIINACYWPQDSTDIISSALTTLNIDELRQWEEDYFEEALEQYGKWSTAIASYWYEPLDQITSWIHPWRLIIVWAWTHVGKTLFSTFTTNQIATLWVPVWYVTYEMRGVEIADRILSTAFRLWKSKYFKNRTDLDLDEKIINKLKQNIDIFFKCKTVEDIILNIKRSHAKKWTKIFFIDHLWLILSDKNDTKNNIIWDITRKLKNICLELNITVIALAQLNRESAKTWSKPKLKDLRDSWNIEQDADVVILLHRNRDDDWKMSDSMEMIVAKNRVNWQFNSCIAEIDDENFRLF